MRIASLLLVVSVAMTSVLWCQGHAAAGEWKPLFDSKTLKGWHPVGDGKWTVEDGVIVGRANNEKLYGLLFSDDQYDNFTVRFQFKCLEGDSGFYIRTVLKKPDQAQKQLFFPIAI